MLQQYMPSNTAIILKNVVHGNRMLLLLRTRGLI